MDSKENNDNIRESAKENLINSMDTFDISFEIISALAGDIDFTPNIQENINKHYKERKDNLFSDIIFAMTHKKYDTEEAKELWNKVLKHKWDMGENLGRNVGIVVSMLDYLYNIEKTMRDPLLISNQDKKYVVEIALHDGLTNLYDHFTFAKKVENEICRHKRYEDPLALAMFDIDNFKNVNDTFGHPVGDEYIKALSKILKEESRETDIVARYGGEEFSILFIRTNTKEAYEIAERIRLKVVEKVKTPIQCTVSIGLSTFDCEVKDADELISNADKALYHSKNTGKNKTTIYKGTNHENI